MQLPSTTQQMFKFQLWIYCLQQTNQNEFIDYV